MSLQKPSVAIQFDKESNTRVKACCLPLELIVSIVVETQRVWPTYRYRQGEYRSGWMAILHVCSVWRRAALSTPTLWQAFNVLKVNPKSVSELLARSANLPLHLTFASLYEERRGNWDGEATLASVCFTASVFCRLETLIINDPPWAMVEPLYVLLRNAPSLRSICLADFTASFYPESDGLLLAPPPQLQRLCLYDGSVPYDFPLFAAKLTHLKLHTQLIGGGGGYLSSIQDVLSLLSTLSSLEHLDFNLPDMNKNVGTPLTKCVMSSTLKYAALNIYYDADDDPPEPNFLGLLKNLFFPATAEVNIDLNFFEGYRYSVAEETLRAVFPDELMDGHHFELEFRDGYQNNSLWHKCSFHSCDATAKSGGVKRFNILLGHCQNRPHYDQSLLSILRPQSLIISGRLLEKLVQGDEHKLRFFHDFWDLRDPRRLSICFSDHHLLWQLFSLETEPPTLPLLDTIGFFSAHRLWKDTPLIITSERKFAIGETMLSVVERAVDTSVLADLVAGLMATIEARREADMPIREIRLDGRLAEWDGWEAVRGVVKVVVV